MQTNPNITNVSTINFEQESIFNKKCNEVSNRLTGEPHSFRNQYLSSNNLPNNLANNLPNTLPNNIANNLPNNLPNNSATSIVNNAENVILAGGNSDEIKTKYYSLMGYEFSLWTLILALIILITIIYFLYKWFFSSDNQIVSIKKPKELIELNSKNNNDTNKKSNNELNKELNKEISDSDSSSSDSSTKPGA